MSDNMNGEKQIGYIVGGALKANLNVRLTVPPQEVQLGSFVVAESSNWKFYSLVTDMQLGNTNARFADEPSEVRLPAGLSKLLHGQTLYTNLEILPALMLDTGPELGTDAYAEWREANPVDPHPMPVKTVPSHHSPVWLATAGDVKDVFGAPNDKNMFVIGHTREQGHPICIDLDEFVKRSAGIFGTTGTGKSFLTRIILAGLLKYDQSSVLVFDMHNEYAYDSTSSDSGMRVTGLKSKFPKVRVVGVGPGADIKGNSPDFNLMLAESDIMPEDIELLTNELNLKETTSATLDALVAQFGRENWFHAFKSMDPDRPGDDDLEGETVAGWAEDKGVNVMAAKALHHKLKRVFSRKYITERVAGNPLGEIIKGLESGLHYVVSFGEFESSLDYLLISNLLTRRIRERWETLTNNYHGHNSPQPRVLVIVIEEAHKLLNREMADQTTFSTIAREMRKYYVTLLVVDQRPSQIYDEVMSQLGTRISGKLGDDADIAAVFSGLAGKEALRGMLASLEMKQEVLLLGWAVPMPIAVRSVYYDDTFWQNLIGKKGGESLEDYNSQLGF